MNKKHYYTKEQDQFLIQNVKGITLKELTARFNKRFSLLLSEDSIANRKNKLKISSGIKGGQFEKGHIPINKGTKGMFNVGGNRTSFKKGNIPQNHKPVGYERINVDGYIEIKTKEPNVFKLKHRVVYEEANGPIPKDCNMDYEQLYYDSQYIIKKLEQQVKLLEKENYIYKSMISSNPLKQIIAKDLIKYIRRGDSDERSKT